jgi:hypothetical protein
MNTAVRKHFQQDVSRAGIWIILMASGVSSVNTFLQKYALYPLHLGNQLLLEYKILVGKAKWYTPFKFK